jgi:LPS-assembly lipoprotein
MRRFAPFVLLAVLLLAGCGFQLRGAVDLPPEMARTYISGLEERDALLLELERQLRSAGAEIVQSRAVASAELRVLGLRDTRRVLTVGGDASVQEYELATTVSFDVRGTDNEFRRERMTLTVVRDMTFDETNVVGKGGEEVLLREEMRRELAWQMVSRLQLR